MKSKVKATARYLFRGIGVAVYRAGLASWVINRSSRTRAVLYHAVEESSSSFTDKLDINVPPDLFALHLDYYARFYNVISMSEHLRAHRANSLSQNTGSGDTGNKKPPLLITFDDGYSSVKDNALPLLEQRKIPATVYLIGNAVRGRMVWVNRLNQAMNEQPEHTREVLDSYPGYPGLNKLPRRSIIHYIQSHFEPAQIEQLVERIESTIVGLTVDPDNLFSSPTDIREMQKRGIEFGFHSNEHYNLGGCTDRELDVALTTDGLETLLNSNTFAYPFGYFSPSTIGRLKRRGYRLLLTVGNSNDRFSELHLDRCEMFEPDFSNLFARLEIEEPIIANIKRFIFRCQFNLQRLRKRQISRIA